MTDILGFLTKRYGDLYVQEVKRTVVLTERAEWHEAECSSHDWRMGDSRKEVVSEGLYDHITFSHDLGRLIGATNMVLHLHRFAHHCRPTVGADDSIWFKSGDACDTLRALARVYVDHPDYDKTWW